MCARIGVIEPLAAHTAAQAYGYRSGHRREVFCFWLLRKPIRADLAKPCGAHTFSSSLVVMPKRCRLLSFFSSSSEDAAACGVGAARFCRGWQLLMHHCLHHLSCDDLQTPQTAGCVRPQPGKCCTHHAEALGALLLLVLLSQPKPEGESRGGVGRMSVRALAFELALRRHAASRAAVRVV